ncbi:hypothetical protein DPMN_092420 [Dreissena polymorpha]|uniref:Uncharacterized protein n=1 Tax=Dreissena polymorpha TaxID=45954 RepID=A0A9D4L1Y9_DREPO|nr:hypothetical protein DPMN_092420 [Dreissena polymorpha]
MSSLPYTVNCPASLWPCFSTDRNNFRIKPIINVTSRVKYAPLAAIFFNEPEPFSKKADISLRLTFFEHDKDITGTTFLTKFHDNQAINSTYRVLPRKNVDDA